jgi:hypothetical protein
MKSLNHYAGIQKHIYDVVNNDVRILLCDDEIRVSDGADTAWEKLQLPSLCYHVP